MSWPEKPTTQLFADYLQAMSVPVDDTKIELVLLEKDFARNEDDVRFTWDITDSPRESRGTPVVNVTNPIRDMLTARILPFVAYFGDLDPIPEYIGVFVREWSGQCHELSNGIKYHFKLATRSFIVAVPGTLSLTAKYSEQATFVFSKPISEVKTITVELNDLKQRLTLTTSANIGTLTTYGSGMNMVIEGFIDGLLFGDIIFPQYSFDIDGYEDYGTPSGDDPYEFAPSRILTDAFPNGIRITAVAGFGEYSLEDAPFATIYTASRIRFRLGDSPSFVIPLEITHSG